MLCGFPVFWTDISIFVKTPNFTKKGKIRLKENPLLVLRVKPATARIVHSQREACADACQFSAGSAPCRLSLALPARCLGCRSALIKLTRGMSARPADSVRIIAIVRMCCARTEHAKQPGAGCAKGSSFKIERHSFSMSCASNRARPRASCLSSAAFHTVRLTAVQNWNIPNPKAYILGNNANSSLVIHCG